MAKNIHKGTELNNISETWDQNERNRAGGDTPSAAGAEDNAATGNADLDRVIKEEATEYDNTSSEDRLLGGERATLNDDPDASAGDE